MSLVLAAAWALPGPAQAQSLVELYGAARAYDATFQSALAQYDASVARAAQARAGILPAVGLSAGASRSELDVSTDAGGLSIGLPTQSIGINATQPIYRPANWATYEQGKRQAEIARAVLDSAEQDLIVRLSQAYFDVLASQDSLALVRAQKSAVAEQLASAQRNFEVGTATITDTREAQARYDLVLAQEIAADNDLQVRRIVLDQLAGRSGSVPAPLRAPATLPELAGNGMDGWVTQADELHPSIRQARLSLDVAALEVEKAQAGHKPTLDANLGYNVNNNPRGTTTSTGRSRINAANVGVSFNLPLFSGFAIENRIKETLALQEQSRAVLESTRRNVSQATRSAYLGLVSGAGQVRALEAAEASSLSALDANRLGYQVGVRINIDVLNSQSQLFQTRRDLAGARYAVLMGNLRLRQAGGVLNEADLLPINAVLATDREAASEASAASPDRPSAATRSPVAPAANTPGSAPGNVPSECSPASGPVRVPMPPAGVTTTPAPGSLPAPPVPLPAMPMPPPAPVILTPQLR